MSSDYVNNRTSMPIWKLKKITQKINLTTMISLIFLINLIAGLYIVFYSLNFSQVDMAGHIWSSVQLKRGYFHTFNDQIFLGYIHGLFYPPAEDLFLTVIALMIKNPFSAYIIYLGLLLPFYFYAVFKLISRLNRRVSLLFAATTILFLMNIEKLDLIKLQGLSLVDLLVTGLSAEILSMSFFLLLIDDIFFTKGSLNKKTFLLTFVAMSHIVIGVVAYAFMVLLLFLESKQIYYLKIVSFSLALSAFYWIPFYYNLSFISPSVIFNYSPWLAFVIASVGSIISLRIKNKISLVFLVTATLLLFTTTIFQWNDWSIQLVPQFHYYRFTIIAYFFIAFGLSFQLDVWNKFNLDRNSKALLILISIVFVIHLGLEFKLQNYNLNWRSFSQTRIKFDSVGNLNQKSYGRYLVFGADRAADTGIEAILSTNFEEFRSTKGLFWESSRTNNVQSSILSTLLSRPVVLDNYFYSDFDCSKLKCLLDQTFRYYNVNGIVGNPDLMNYLPLERKTCYQEIFKTGTTLHVFSKTGELNIANQVFSIFKLIPNKQQFPFHYSNEAVEPLTRDGLKILNTANGTAYAQVMDEIYNSCDNFENSHLHTFVQRRDFEAISSLNGGLDHHFKIDKVSDKIEFRRLKTNEFKITTPADQKRLYVVKLSPQPGMNAYDAANNRIPLFAAYPYIIVYGSGEVILKFERTLDMYLGYIVTTLAIIIFLLFLKKKAPLN